MEQVLLFSVCRGGIDGVQKVQDEKYKAFWTKDFAIAYDRLICLKGGHYHFSIGSHTNNAHVAMSVYGTTVQKIHKSNDGTGNAYGCFHLFLKRGDYVQRVGGYEANGDNWWGIMECYRIQ